MTFAPDRPPKRYTAKQFAEWRARWTGIEPDDALRNPPFGTTDEALLDFRGLTVRKPGPGLFKQFDHANFKGCDFTAASFAETNCSHCIFQDCVFDYVDLNNFGDYGCMFTNCRFYRGEWQAGAVGLDLNTSARGEYQSRYINCHFENIKLTKTSIGDPQFINCSFVFKKLSGIDFRCSGFIACRFIGAFQDITFRGAYDQDERARKGDPEFAGLFDVDFQEAALQWFDIRGGFPVRSVRMPKDASAFTADLPRLCSERAALIAQTEEGEPRTLITRYLNITCRFAAEQAVDIVSRYDLIESAGKGGEDIAAAIFDTLKQRYEISV